MPLGEKNTKELPTATGGKAMVAMVGGPNLQPPPHFDFENPAIWQRWRQQFDDYSFAMGLHAADDEVRVRTLLYCMGTRSRDILCSLQLVIPSLPSEPRAKPGAQSQPGGTITWPA
ncbi:hypothetical protein MTO96_031965 [Rhipicephalus appendiculatus]